ncbi:MAG: hypothetical protein ACRDD7_01290 [Peptostreptococcaceae bacterium]
MVDNNFVEMLAFKILNKQINPNTNNPFTIDDIKKEEYKNPVKLKINELEKGL